MKKVLLFLILFPFFAGASSRDAIHFIPSTSIFVVGVDFPSLRTNETYLDLEKSGKIWSRNGNGDELTRLSKILKLEPARDIQTFVFARYTTFQGSHGKVRIIELKKMPSLENFAATRYSSSTLYRLENDRDFYVAKLTGSTLCFGNLNEVKMAIDVQLGKVSNLSKNANLNALLQRIPQEAAIWGLAEPLTREKASRLGVKQSTHAVLEAFDQYYFYGIPSRKTTRSHFIGTTSGEKEAVFVNTFMIGTLTFAKFRVDDEVAEMLDEVNIERDGRNIRVSAVVTKEMVDAYLNGKLGVN